MHNEYYLTRKTIYIKVIPLVRYNEGEGSVRIILVLISMCFTTQDGRRTKKNYHWMRAPKKNISKL